MDNESVSDKLARGAYSPTLPYKKFNREDGEAHVAYQKQRRQLEAQFKADVLKEVGLTDHPKAEKVWDKAWDDGHADGLSEVFRQLRELAELVL